MEIPAKPESKSEQLGKKIAQLLENKRNTIAVEVYGSGIGRIDEDSVTEPELDAEAAAVSEQYREELVALLEGESVQAEILAAFDNDKLTQDDLQEKILQILSASEENIAEAREQADSENEEFDYVQAELPKFLDAVILENQNDRAEMSKWGNAKLAHEKGDSTKLQEALQKQLDSTDEEAERVKIETFLRFL